VKTTHFT